MGEGKPLGVLGETIKETGSVTEKTMHLEVSTAAQNVPD